MTRIEQRIVVICVLLLVLFLIIALPENKNVFTGYITATIDVQSSLENQSCNLVFRDGFNLIDQPCLLSDMSPENVFGNTSSQYISVHTYEILNNSDPWKAHHPNLPAYVIQDLTEVDIDKGYWINVNENATLNLTGNVTFLQQIALYEGWNLFGYALNSSKNASQLLSSLSGSFTILYTYNASDEADPWKVYNPNIAPGLNDLEYFHPYQAYWINMTANETLTLV